MGFDGFLEICLAFALVVDAIDVRAVVALAAVNAETPEVVDIAVDAFEATLSPRPCPLFDTVVLCAFARRFSRCAARRSHKCEGAVETVEVVVGFWAVVIVDGPAIILLIELVELPIPASFTFDVGRGEGASARREVEVRSGASTSMPPSGMLSTSTKTKPDLR